MAGTVQWRGREPRANRPKRSDDEDEVDDNLQFAESDDIEKPPGLENGPTPPFGVLCMLFDQFESATRNKHKKVGYKGELLGQFISHWRAEIGPDLYPLIRLMLPERDTRRRTYNLKEQKLAKAIIQALDLPQKTSVALKLINWKVPTKEDPGAGEFAAVAYDVIKSRSTVIRAVSDVTIDEINETLDELSHTRGTTIDANGQKRGMQAEHARILRRCVSKMTPAEMKWLIRIILRDLKIGMGEKTIFNQLHPDAMDLFNTCSDIKRVCYKLFDPHQRIPHEDHTVKINQVFRPMLCWRTQRSLSDVIKAMRRNRSAQDPNRPLEEGEYAKDEFIIEEKLDGERIQLHKKGDVYLYASRKSKDYTYLYGADASTGSLTPFIQDCLNENIEEIILDGEMLVWDPKIGKYMAFGNLKTFASNEMKHFGPNDPRPCFKVFDILYIKGKGGKATPLIEKSLWRRKHLLGQVITQKQGVMEIADCARGSSIDDIREYLQRILEERGEGLVCKHPLSTYVLGGRMDSWVKIKPDYMDELGEKIDGLIVGGYWGQGSRGGRLASFLVGLRGTKNGKEVYKSFAKVGSGLSRADYTWIVENTRGKWIDFDRRDSKSVPDWFETVTEWPDVLIDPADSFIIEIKAAEIVEGAEYGAGMTLRFPRASKIRDELDPLSDSMDFETVLAFRRAPKKRPFGDDLASKSKAIRINRNGKARAVSSAVGDVEQTSDVFEDVIFCALGNLAAHRSNRVYLSPRADIHQTKPPELKEQLQKKVVEAGGNYIQTIPPADIERVVVASEYAGIKNKKGGKEVDIVTPEWVLKSIERKRRLPLHKRYLVHAMPKTMSSPDYEADSDNEGMQVEGSEDVKPDVSQGAPRRITAAEAWSQYRGEVAADDEDDPETEDDEGELLAVKTEDAPLPEVPQYEDYWPRKGTMAPPVNAINQDVGKLDLGTSSSQEKKPDADSFGGRVEDLQLGAGESSARSETVAADNDGLTDAPPGMGAGADDQKAFDPDRPLAPFVAYFDTRAGAEKNDLPSSKASDRVQTVADSQLAKAKTAFEEAGGIATDDLHNPKLTHIIITKLVPDRYKELINRTAEPRYRRIVTTEWIDACIEEEGPMDEDDFKP
ncbi:ATP dependent DNA ligase domain-domain containing protein [Rhodotorula toruloides]|uniref:DNA ligase n=1 Tax=Rhodotorula toruloides TaxID=5286 RepID=A0A2T0AG74_RHOTO|nr:ATP dependent DNA ligase domain-domain containing protein [Rhodotorula toruloides]